MVAGIMMKGVNNLHFGAYADFIFDTPRNRLIAVREDHRGEGVAFGQEGQHDAANVAGASDDKQLHRFTP